MSVTNSDGFVEPPSDEDESWSLELEAALLSNCDFATLRSISKNRPLNEEFRPQAWQILLGVSNKGDVFQDWDGLYDLADQSEVRLICQKIVDKIGNPESDKLSIMSELESLLTVYCKNRSIDCLADENSGGWADVLQLLMCLNLPRSQLYSVFFAITTKYIPRGCVRDGRPFDLFRLLLQYHEPHLCSVLDTLKITPDAYAQQWFTALFSSVCDMKVVLRMWDVYFQQADPFVLFFMALVILVNAKDQLFEMSRKQGMTNEQIVAAIKTIPSQLEADDIEDFCQLALFYSAKTPQSFRRDYHGPLFGSNLAVQSFEHITVHSLLCLPVSVQELLQAKQHQMTPPPNQESAVSYFVFDTRPKLQYDCGHFPGAQNLDASLLVNNPSEFHITMQSLMAFKAKTHPDDNVCFMGSGHEEEDKYLHMVISSFLQRAYAHISLARGGYQALHDLLRENLSTKLSSHKAAGCIVCNPPINENPEDMEMSPVLTSNSRQQQGSNWLGKVTSAMANKSSEWKERVVDYIVNPTGDDLPRHANPADRRTGRAYRNIDSMFSIDDDQSDDSGQSGEQVRSPGLPKEKVLIEEFLKRADVIETFECHEVTESADLIPSHLVVTKTYLFALRHIDENNKFALIQMKRPLNTVVRITSKKRYPELITFKFGWSERVDAESDETTIKLSGVDRFLIPKAGDAVRIVKRAVVELQEELNSND